MTILEVVTTRSEALGVAFGAQRRILRQSADVEVVDLSSASTADKEKWFRAVEKLKTKPDAILLRGAGDAHLPTLYAPRVPLFVDHCSPLELGKTSPLRRALQGARRVYCYCVDVDNELRRTGVARVTALAGPSFTIEEFHPHNEVPVVAVLDMSRDSMAILARILSVQKSQGWEFEVVTTMQHRKVRQVGSDLEAVEGADVVVAAYEDKDFGQPHDGALLAMAFTRPLIAARTKAFDVMGFPRKNHISALKYQFGSYAGGVGTYLQHRAKYDEWAGKPVTATALPEDLLSRL